MTNEARLRSLFLSAGLKDDGLNLAEIRAYCAGLDLVKQELDEWRAHLPKGMLIIPPDRVNIEDALEETEYTLSDTEISFSDYDIDTIGVICENWIGLNMRVLLDGDGASWSEIEAQGLSWYELDSRRLRWSMIRSVNYV